MSRLAFSFSLFIPFRGSSRDKVSAFIAICSTFKKVGLPRKKVTIYAPAVSSRPERFLFFPFKVGFELTAAGIAPLST